MVTRASLIAVGVRHDTVHSILCRVSQRQRFSFATRSFLVLFCVVFIWTQIPMIITLMQQCMPFHSMQLLCFNLFSRIVFTCGELLQHDSGSGLNADCAC